MVARWDDTAAPARAARPRSRRAPLAGIGFVVLFVGSVVASNPPANDASDADWVATYRDHAHQLQPFATGVCLVLAGLCLATFLVTLWTRIADASRPGALSPMPVVAAGISGACIAVGGIFFSGIAGTMIFSNLRMPAADLLRYANEMGFSMVGVAGMWSAAVSVACLSVQARSVGFFSRRLSVFGLVVAAILVLSPLFIPIVALLVWLVVISILLLRRGGAVATLAS